MGKPQSSFLASFQDAFRNRSGLDLPWTGGQSAANTSALPNDSDLRRPGQTRSGERIELGDLAVDVGVWRVVIEFESREVPLSNLLKYWPYIRGELQAQPTRPVLICHFSDWWSYATRRDLWKWTMGRMKSDSDRVVDIEGRQFDHWGSDVQRRNESVTAAIDWILSTSGAVESAA